jgi:hypothetical protein
MKVTPCGYGSPLLLKCSSRRRTDSNNPGKTHRGQRDLSEGQKIAYEVVADRLSGKSSRDNLKRSEIANNISGRHRI